METQLRGSFEVLYGCPNPKRPHFLSSIYSFLNLKGVKHYIYFSLHFKVKDVRVRSQLWERQYISFEIFMVAKTVRGQIHVLNSIYRHLNMDGGICGTIYEYG